MKAHVLTSLDGPGALKWADVDDPVPRADEVLIEVTAVGVNYPDLLMTTGAYQAAQAPPFIPGNEVAGRVISAPATSGLSRGCRVVALSGTGAYAERVAVPADRVLTSHPALSDGEAVAMVANHQTAYFALRLRGALDPGETVLVLGGAGGLGSAGIQVAAGLGARVIAVTRRAETAEALERLGADVVVPPVTNWHHEVVAVTGGRGVDLVVDPVGGELFADAVNAMAPGGRLLVLGFAGGGIPSLKVNRLLPRNVSVIGAGWGEYVRRNRHSLASVDQGLRALVDDGLRPFVTARMPLCRAGEALQLLARGAVMGKLVLEA